MYDSQVARHLASIERRHYRLIKKRIVEQLRFEPERERRNRKPLLRPSSFGAAWELRFGPHNRFRVFYRVDAPAREVHILAMASKLAIACLLAERSLSYEDCTSS